MPQTAAKHKFLLDGPLEKSLGALNKKQLSPAEYSFDFSKILVQHQDIPMQKMTELESFIRCTLVGFSVFSAYFLDQQCSILCELLM